MKKFFVGVKGLFLKDEKVLLLRKVDVRDFWDIPGGRINDNEDIITALRRELHEELPTLESYEIGDLVAAERIHRDVDDDTSLVLLFYKIDNPIFDGDIALSSEHDKYEWRPVTEAIADNAVKESIRKALERQYD